MTAPDPSAGGLTAEEQYALAWASGHLDHTASVRDAVEHLHYCPTCSATGKTARRTIAARTAALSAENARLVETLGRVAALLPAECWVTRGTTTVRCADMIGAKIGDGPGVWTESACCLPCRIRAALGTTGGGE